MSGSGATTEGSRVRSIKDSSHQQLWAVPHCRRCDWKLHGFSLTQPIKQHGTIITMAYASSSGYRNSLVMLGGLSSIPLPFAFSLLDFPAGLSIDILKLLVVNLLLAGGMDRGP